MFDNDDGSERILPELCYSIFDLPPTNSMTLISRQYRRRQRGRFDVAGIDELIETGEVNFANDFALTFRDVLTDERRKLPEQLYHCAFRMTAAICGREFGNSRLAELAE